MDTPSIQRPKSEMRVQVVCSELHELARKKGPHAPLPNVAQLCECFGAGEDTILKAVKDLENRNVLYRDAQGRIYASAAIHNKMVCFVLSAQHFHLPGASPFWDLMWGYCLREAERRSELGYDFMFYMDTPSHTSMDPLQESLVKKIAARQIHGILGIGLRGEAGDWLNEQKVPYVVFAAWAKCRVVIDYTSYYRMAAQSLAEQGCRRIGFWNAASPYEYIMPEKRALSPRLTSIMDAMQNAGLVFDPALMKDYWHLLDGPDRKTVQSSIEEGFQKIGTYQQQGYRAVMDVFGTSSASKPDGLMIQDDMMTSGALVAFEELGIRIGEDVKIASHANAGSTVLFGYKDDLTLIEVDPAEIVHEMFNLLESLMGGKAAVDTRALVTPVLHLPKRRSLLCAA